MTAGSGVSEDYTITGNTIIDYIFVSDQSIDVRYYEIWDNKINGKYPSDHIPVWAELTIQG